MLQLALLKRGSEAVGGNMMDFAESVAFQQYVYHLTKMHLANDISLTPYTKSRGIYAGRTRKQKSKAVLAH